MSHLIIHVSSLSDRSILPLKTSQLSLHTSCILLRGDIPVYQPCPTMKKSGILERQPLVTCGPCLFRLLPFFGFELASQCCDYSFPDSWPQRLKLSSHGQLRTAIFVLNSARDKSLGNQVISRCFSRGLLEVI